jgi:hypothetical protein
MFVALEREHVKWSIEIHTTSVVTTKYLIYFKFCSIDNNLKTDGVQFSELCILLDQFSISPCTVDKKNP